MADEQLLIRYHEIGLKGRNRRFFVDRLVDNMRHALKRHGTDAAIHREYGQVRVVLPEHSDPASVVQALARVYGIARIAVAFQTGRDLADIEDGVERLIETGWGSTESFRISASRADKRYPLDSMELDRRIGALVQDRTGARVDLNHPDLDIRVDVREKDAYVYTESFKGAGGLPVGSSGHVVALLSGGIDSPVAAARMMRRGCTVSYVHFHSFPLVDGSSRDKARELAEVLNGFQSGSRLHLVPFSDIQMQIVAAVPPAYRVVAYRRFMVRVAQEIARKEGALALVTGESVGQVASQTVENISAIDAVATMPLLRPLVGMDKLEIIDEARAIGTYEISILPDEDCCSLFVPRHPALRATPATAGRYERVLDVESLVQQGVSGAQTLEYGRPRHTPAKAPATP